MFRSLTREDIEKIARNMLAIVAKRMEGMEIRLNVTDGAIELLAEHGYDPNYGARPLRRTIQTELEDRLAECMLDGSVKAGDTVNVTAEDGKLAVKAAEAAKAE